MGATRNRRSAEDQGRAPGTEAESDRALLERLDITGSDLRHAQRFASAYLERGLGRMEKAYDDEARAFSLALVVSYARPFSGNQDRTGGRDRSSLDFLLAGLSRSGMAEHREALRRRNRALAHSDAVAHDVELVDRGGERLTVSHDPQLPLEDWAVRQLQENAQKMLAALEPRLGELRERLAPDKVRESENKMAAD